MLDKDILDELREILNQKLAETDSHTRAKAFTSIFLNEIRALVLEFNPLDAASVILMNVLHAANRHPEWLKAVCEDQKEIITPTGDSDEKLIEDALMEIVGWYPLPVRMTERE